MRFPLQIAAFATAYHIGTQLPARLLRKFSKKNTGINNDTYIGEFDYVSRFRLFEKDSEALGNSKVSDAENMVLDYLSTYSEDPLSEPELINHLAKGAT